VTDPATPPPTAATAPEPPAEPEPASPAPAAAAEPSPRQRPTRRIAALVGVALVTTLAIVGFVAIVRPGPAGGGIAKGQPVPEIRGVTLDGAPIDLASLRGHPVLINFWGPSCVPCREEMPLLAQKAREHAGSGLQILGVLMYDAVQPARDFTKEFGGTWPTVVDPDGSIRQAYQAIARPQSYFIDKDGILRSIQIGYLTDADFERQLAMISGGG
jgi:cytochrome c biogenesis protein CcmG/thiol:disulfide interchange protein DsbE